MKRGIIDIGNTMVKWAVFEDLSLLEAGHTAPGDWQPLVSAQEKFALPYWYWSGSGAVPDFSGSGIEARELDFSGPLPVTNRYRTPSSLGRDRLAGVCGAALLFPGEAALVIDAGTCITCDYIDQMANYYGGSISPGLEMRLKAMNAFTERLPLLEWKDTEGFIGDSTEQSMLLGVKQGLIGEVSRQIALYESHSPGIRILLSGGDAPFFEKHLKKDIFAAPNIVLVGLNSIQHLKTTL